MRILITGGAGFIGSRLALSLVKAGHTVRVLDNLHPQIHGADGAQSPLLASIRDVVEFVRGDVRSREDVRRSLAGVDAVVHLAAETGTGQSMYAIENYTDVNIGGTARLLDVIVSDSLPVSRIVVASSRAVYGEGQYRCVTDGRVFPGSRLADDMARGDFEVHCPVCGAVVVSEPTSEDARLSPSSIYGVTKLTQEQLVLTFARANGISAFAFRYQNVYGPGQSLTNPYTGILSIFSTRIRNGNPINLFEDGKESRDFVYIDDVVAATHRALEHPDPVVAVLNVGSGVATDVTQVAATLQTALGRSTPTAISGQFRIGDIRHNTADLSALRATLGFTPSTTFADGVNAFARWVLSEPIGQDKFEESLRELADKGLLK